MPERQSSISTFRQAQVIIWSGVERLMLRMGQLGSLNDGGETYTSIDNMINIRLSCILHSKRVSLVCPFV